MSDLRDEMHRQLGNGALMRQAQAFAQDYLAGLDQHPAFPPAQAIAALEGLAGDLPDGPGDADRIIADLHRIGGAATTGIAGGRYFGFVNGGTLPVALAARWLADAWDQNAALGVMSPVAARLEAVAEAWLVDLLGLPRQTAVGFVTGSAMAIFCGLAAGRRHLLDRAGWDVNARGLNGAPPLRIVAGRQTHAAVLRALVLLGFGTDSIEWMDVDDQGRAIPESCPTLDDRTILILQAGEVNSGAFDPFDRLIPMARAAGAWTHVDGAFGLWAAAAPRFADLTRGLDGAQSYSVDGHKTLNLPYDSGMALCTEPRALATALQADGAYLVRDGARDGMFLVPEMSRRARGVEVWAALAWLGRQGVAELVEGLCDHARDFAVKIRAAGFEVLNDVVFNQVIVATGDGAETDQTLAQLQASGRCWAGGSTWFGRPVVRISVCSWATTQHDIDTLVAELAAARQRAKKSAGGETPGAS